jgi:hypothetical protein
VDHLLDKPGPTTVIFSQAAVDVAVQAASCPAIFSVRAGGSNGVAGIVILAQRQLIFDALFISGVISSHSLFLAALARRACVTQLKTML